MKISEREERDECFNKFPNYTKRYINLSDSIGVDLTGLMC